MHRLKTRFAITYITAIAAFLLLTVVITALVVFVILVRHGERVYTFFDVPGSFLHLNGAMLLPYLLLWLLLLILAAVSIGAFLLSRLHHKVTMPIEDLRIATDYISNGEYDADIIGGEDLEINDLCRSLDKMRLRLKEKSATEAAIMADRNLLIANISHDMRTPLTTIRGYLQAIEDGVAQTPEQIQNCYDHIKAKTEFLEFLAADMSEYSDQESGRLRYCFEDVELCGFLRDMAAEYGEDTASKGFEFSISIPETEVYLRADCYRLQRVLQNVLSNAIKYNKPGGRIDVSLEVTPPYAYICVADSGIGVADESLKKVFDSFYREDSSRGNVSGHGLGLAIARQIVESHKGKIWMQSKENEGTQVFLCFPLAEELHTKHA